MMQSNSSHPKAKAEAQRRTPLPFSPKIPMEMWGKLLDINPPEILMGNSSYCDYHFCLIIGSTYGSINNRMQVRSKPLPEHFLSSVVWPTELFAMPAKEFPLKNVVIDLIDIFFGFFVCIIFRN
jgi:hypothetical protein